MKLSDDDIQEFIGIWKKEFGETLSPDEARHEASQLIRLCALLAQPLPNQRKPGHTGP